MSHGKCVAKPDFCTCFPVSNLRIILNMKTQNRWNEINWKLCEQQLALQQNRLAIATTQGETSEINRLQTKIMRMFAARALAVRKVTSNRGKSTPGVDKETWNTAEKKFQAVERLKDLSRYEPQPVRRIWIPKPGKAEKRPLGIPTLFDRAVQALVLQAFEPVVESRADVRSFGFRRYRSVHDAAEYIRLLCASQYSKRYILEVDIRKFFDTISHDWLLEHMPMNKTLLRKILKAGLLDLQKFDATELGVPQGGVLSPCLANATLDGLEMQVNSTGAFIVRYADDFIVASNKESGLKEAQIQIERFLDERSLSVNQEKTRITTIEEGFDFLGFHFREYPDSSRAKFNKLGIFLVKPRPQNVVRVCKKISETVRKLSNACAATVIMKLNPILRGWAEHYRTATSRTAFRKVSLHVFRVLKKWAYRKHKKAGRRTTLKRYFKTINSPRKPQNWVFSAMNERRQPVALFQVGRTTFCKHKLIAIKLPKNPFLLEHQSYFEKRALEYIRSSALLDKKKAQILIQQKGACAYCNQVLQPQDVIEIHHIVGIKQGGSDALSNLMAVHQMCHRQITYAENHRNSGGQLN